MRRAKGKYMGQEISIPLLTSDAFLTISEVAVSVKCRGTEQSNIRMTGLGTTGPP